MKKLLLVVLSISLISFNLAAKERVIVSSDDVELVKEFVLKNNGQVVKSLSFKNAVVIKLENSKISKLKNKFGKKVSIEEDIIHSIIAKPDRKPKPDRDPEPTLPQEVPWGIDRIGSLAAQTVTRGEGVVVCVVDTGVDLDHEDLRANIIGNVNTISTRKSGNDDNGHGTHVAGTIAALDNEIGVIGVAPDAKILAVKGLDRRGSGYSSDLAEGIHACINSGASVINMSWGSASASSIIQDAVISAHANGIVLVGAAGNESAPVIYPAAFQEVIAVSAVDSSMNIAYFSNYGSEIEFAAPGVNILSTYKNGEYASLNGTSMASPHVAGVAALMLSAGSSHLQAEDIGLDPYLQGNGLIDALLTVGF